MNKEIINQIIEFIPDEGVKSIDNLKGKEVNVNIPSGTKSSILIKNIIFEGDDRIHKVIFNKPNTIVNIINYLGVPHYKFSANEGMNWIEINAEGKIRDYNPYIIGDEYIPIVSFDDKFNQYVLRELRKENKIMDFSTRLNKVFSYHGVGFKDPMWKGPSKLIIEEEFSDDSIDSLVDKYKDKVITVLQFKKDNVVSIYIPIEGLKGEMTVARVPTLDTKFAGTETQYGIIHFTTKKLSELLNRGVQVLGTYCIYEHGEIAITEYKS